MVVSKPATDPLPLFVSLLAIEAQAFSLRVPECFFSMYSPVRSDATARADRDRLMEDIRFAAKSVRSTQLLSLSLHCSPSLTRAATLGLARSRTCASRSMNFLTSDTTHPQITALSARFARTRVARARQRRRRRRRRRLRAHNRKTRCGGARIWRAGSRRGSMRRRRRKSCRAYWRLRSRRRWRSTSVRILTFRCVRWFCSSPHSLQCDRFFRNRIPGGSVRR